MNRIFVLLSTVISISLNAQLCVNKTLAEVKEICKKKGLTLESESRDTLFLDMIEGSKEDKIALESKATVRKNAKGRKYDYIVHKLTFGHAVQPFEYWFEFNEKGICVNETIMTWKKEAKDSLIKNFNSVAYEKLTDKAWAQKKEGKVYGWSMSDFNTGTYVFNCSELKQ